MQFDETKVIEALNDEWGWTLPSIGRVLAVSTMGNVFLASNDQTYWRICPEELSAEIVARTPAELNPLYSDPDYKADWQMSGIVGKLIAQYGEPLIGECFGFVILGALGGKYALENIRRRELYEYLRFTGSVARQTKNLPDGETVKFDWKW